MNTNRFKNPYFWIGLFGVIFTAMGIDINTLNSWNVLFTEITHLFGNPAMLISVIMAVVGVFVDPTSKGFKDNK